MTSRRNRTVLGVVIVAVALVAAGVALALRPGPSPRPLVVQGRVTGTDGQPVRGIKVWLNALPTASVVRQLTDSHQPLWVTVVGSAITSATGRYVLRVVPSAALAADATNGIVKFMVMTGNGAGWDTLSFSRGLGPTAGTTSAVPWGGTKAANLRLMRN